VTLTRRLYLQVYLAMLGIVVAFGAVVVAAWLVAGRSRHDAHLLRALSRMATDVVPPPGRPAEETAAAMARLSRRLGVVLALHTPDGRVIAGAGGDVPRPRATWSGSHWLAGSGGPGVALRLEDGRWLVAQRGGHGHAVGGLVTLLVLAGVVALGAYPVARRVTRRLERLQQRVDELGRGDLKARVEVEGKDEVAELARSFNQAAERIERLVGSQRSVLAGASHELRSPLARIRMAAELLGESAPPGTAAQLARDVDELDELVAELLLASRLQARPRPERVEEIDLLALLAEECARASAEAEGVPVHVTGDRRMLRRMVRNLLENARRHGAGSPVEASVTEEDGRAVVRIEDRGPGVPEGERERIFEPFYRPAGWREGPEGGVGLGLALVRQIAQHHGGDARCRPREGGGSRFEVFLPVIAPSALGGLGGEAAERR
jgi:signal transduction histidine kinase